MTQPTPDAHPHGILFVLSGPSGVGKDTVLRRALPKLGRIRTSISVTTRAPRPREAFGVDYFFVTRDEFLAMQAKGDLLEHALVHDNFYGTPRGWLLEQLQQGIDVVLAIDVQGALQVRRLYPEAVLIFLAPPSWDELTRRLRGRATEDEATMQRRLENARQELSRVDEYNYLIVNDNLHEATERLRAIVLAERSRPCRQEHRLQGT